MLETTLPLLDQAIIAVHDQKDAPILTPVVIPDLQSMSKAEYGMLYFVNAIMAWDRTGTPVFTQSYLTLSQNTELYAKLRTAPFEKVPILGALSFPIQRGVIAMEFRSVATASESGEQPQLGASSWSNTASVMSTLPVTFRLRNSRVLPLITMESANIFTNIVNVEVDMSVDNLPVVSGAPLCLDLKSHPICFVWC